MTKFVDPQHECLCNICGKELKDLLKDAEEKALVRYQSEAQNGSIPTNGGQVFQGNHVVIDEEKEKERQLEMDQLKESLEA